MDMLTEDRHIAACKIVQALASQPGIDVMPAAAALPRFLNAVYARTGYKFKHIGHGRHREVFEIVHPDNLGLVLKVGNKQSNSREIAMTVAFPEDWAKIYDTFDYGVVSERANMISSLDDPRMLTPEFKARVEKFNERYIALSQADLGFVGDRIVIVGSSIRVRIKDVSGQNRAV